MGPLSYPKISGYADAALDAVAWPDYAHPRYAFSRGLCERDYAGAGVAINRSKCSYCRRQRVGPELGRPSLKTAASLEWPAARIVGCIGPRPWVPKRRDSIRAGA